jgi:hypothetical protein
MTKLTSLFLIIIFFLSVFIGITVGFTFKQGQVTPTPTSTTCSVSVDTVGSLIVIGVNDFNAEEIYLESAWFVTINRTQQASEILIEVLLVSAYPLTAGQNPSPSQAQYLEEHPAIVFPREFLNNLEDSTPLQTLAIFKQPIYQDVIVIDEYAMNYIIELTNANPVLPPPTDTTFPKPWEDPPMALLIQHNLLQNLCSPPQNILEYQNFTQVFNLFPDHFKSTLTPEDILAFWQVYVTNQTSPVTVTCSIYP